MEQSLYFPHFLGYDVCQLLWYHSEYVYCTLCKVNDTHKNHDTVIFTSHSSGTRWVWGQVGQQVCSSNLGHKNKNINNVPNE